MEQFSNKVLLWTEKRLTHKKALKLYKKQHKTFVSELLEWIDAILFAVVVVFFINQWLFQLFVIPSPSMEQTLMTGDRVLVSKVSYGVELYPEGPKVFDAHEPDRDDIITFYNPESESKGTLFNILSQMIYRATFTLVNIDKNEDGSMRESLLVKRTGAVAGDTVKFVDGDLFIKASGTDKFIAESEFRAANGLDEGPNRSIDDSLYEGYNALGILNGLNDCGVSTFNLPTHLRSDYTKLDTNAYFADSYGYDSYVARGQRMADPTSLEIRSDYSKTQVGIYVPAGYVLPLGDNRDHSGDGRYFGPVSTDTINGYVVTKIWPLNRVGSPY